MAQTTSKTTSKRPRKHWGGFLDKFRREIVPEHFRGKLSGDVFLGFDPADIPPQGTTVELRVTAKVGGAHLKPTDEAAKAWVAYVDLKASEAHDLVIIVPEAPSTAQVTVDEAIQRANGGSHSNGDGTRRSATKARAASRKRTATRAR